MSLKSRVLVGLSILGFRWRFIVARATRLDPVGRLVGRMLFDEDRMMYLPKDTVAQKALEKTVTVQLDKRFEAASMVLPSQVLEHFIRESQYRFVMDFCICRQANDCQSYPKNYGCLFLGRGALKIDRRYGRLVTAEEAIEHMRRCREAGLVHLIGRNKIDAVVFDTGRKEDLLSICSCCPCCCLWKMLPDLNEGISSGVTRMPGVSVVATDKCTGCGECVNSKVCFVGALSLNNRKIQIDQDRCRACGRCIEICTNDALELKIEDKDFLQKSIEIIEPLVDVRAKSPVSGDGGTTR